MLSKGGIGRNRDGQQGRGIGKDRDGQEGIGMPCHAMLLYKSDTDGLGEVLERSYTSNKYVAAIKKRST